MHCRWLAGLKEEETWCNLMPPYPLPKGLRRHNSTFHSTER